MGEDAYVNMIYEKAREKRPNSRKYNRDKISPKEKRKIWLNSERQYLSENNEVRYQKNKDRLIENNKRWVEKNKERYKMIVSSWNKKKRRGIRKYGEPLGEYQYLKRLFIENPELKLARVCAANIKRYINTSRERYYDIIGCTNHELKIYLESKFLDGMTWENHGKWHIDHIIPLASANSESEAIALNHYTNLQPLWAVDNLRKGKRIL